MKFKCDVEEYCGWGFVILTSPLWIPLFIIGFLARSMVWSIQELIDIERNLDE